MTEENTSPKIDLLKYSEVDPLKWMEVNPLETPQINPADLPKHNVDRFENFVELLDEDKKLIGFTLE